MSKKAESFLSRKSQKNLKGKLLIRQKWPNIGLKYMNLYIIKMFFCLKKLKFKITEFWKSF